MPVQFPHNDQVPGLTFAGYSGLGAGIGSGVQAIGAALEKRAKERKRLLQAGKAADAFYKALPEDQLPMPPEDWALRSPIEKASAMTGIIGAQHYKRGVADTKRTLAIAAMEQEQLANAARAPKFLEDLSRFAAPGDLPQNLQPEDYGLPEGQPHVGLREMARAAARTGFAPKLSEFDDILRASAADQPLDLTVHPPVTQELPGGQIGYGFPGTKVRGVYPDVTKALQQEVITLPSGEEVLTLRPPGAKSVQTVRERPEKGEITKDSIHRRLTATYQSQLAHPSTRAAAAETLKQLQALERGEETPAATPEEAPAKAKGLPKPASKAEYDKLPSGAHYVDPTGVERVKG